MHIDNASYSVPSDNYSIYASETGIVQRAPRIVAGTQFRRDDSGQRDHCLVPEPILILERPGRGPSGSTVGSSCAEFRISKHSVDFSHQHTQLDIALSNGNGQAYSMNSVMSLLYNGNVGIGTTSPVSKLQIGNGTSSGTKSSVAQICGESSAANNELIALSLVNSKVDGSSTENGIATSLAFHLAKDWSPTGKISTIKTGSGAKSSMIFHTYDSTLTERMRITNAGNVGIGTDAPKTSLDIQGDGTNCLCLRNGNPATGYSKSQILLSYNGAAYNGTGAYTHKIQSRHQAGATHNQNAIDFYLWKHGQENNEIGNAHGMSITAGGVGIGTDNPDFKLEVASTDHTILGIRGGNDNTQKNRN